jgi:SAM-dependent methyltransferase
MGDGESYLLGMEAEEVGRLERQHDTWREPTEHIWRLAGFAEGQVIVDLGSGPGFCSLDLARLVGPRGRVVAVDSSVAALGRLAARAEREGVKNVERVLADVSAFDPAPWKPDGVFARWLFSFLPDPDGVVARLAAGLDPGATVAVMDYWNYLAIHAQPATPLFDRVFRAVYDSFAAAGGSLDVGGRLPAAFASAGLRLERIELISRLGRPGDPIWRWVSDFQRIYLPTLVDGGYLSAAELAEYRAWWEEREADGSAFFHAPPVLGVIGRKAG